MLVNYTSDKGDKLQARSSCRPSTRRARRTRPSCTSTRSCRRARTSLPIPTRDGFNRSVYTSNGYAVLMPDITYKVNDPGMSAVWCVVPALKAAIATGVVDREASRAARATRGAATRRRSLITQTDMFDAAVAGAPLTEHGQHVQLDLLEHRRRQRRDLRVQPGPLHGRLLGQLGRVLSATHRCSSPRTSRRR